MKFCSATKNDQNAKKCVNHNSLSHGIQASVARQPGSNFRGKKIKNLAIVDDAFFSLELELGTYINLYSFQSSIERPFRDIFFFQTQQKFLITPNRPSPPNPLFAKISSQTLTSKRYNTSGSIAITHRQKYNLFLNNPALFC